ncbi:MAG: DUF1949 domain-containing protein [Bacteroidetes bacterium]|nr:MAG: DUF1949 domain-containing protein [Bacteroidota bacterium]
MILLEREKASIKEKGSRFISRAIPVTTREQASVELALLKKKEYDATHHCSAYRIGPTGELYRSSDDGEPSGTAGVPILRQIESAGITDTLVVVTRYYGGTKLGTGGLIRAYGDAAAAVLRSASTERITHRESVKISFDYADTSPAMFTIQQFDAKVGATEYGDLTVIEVLVKRSEAEAFRQLFINALSGRGKLIS